MENVEDATRFDLEVSFRATPIGAVKPTVDNTHREGNVSLASVKKAEAGCLALLSSRLEGK